MKSAQVLTASLQRLPALAYFLMLLALAFLVHFRFGLFYHWDEWNVLDRFFANGASAAFVSHNEHFLPLFFLTYFFEVGLFGLHYWALVVVSLSLHAVNAYLLSVFLEKLGEPWALAKSTGRVVALLYLVSALHAETLQWAFEQSLQLRQILSFAALLAAFAYIRQGNNKSLLYAALLCTLAPFFFGSGLLLPFECALLFLYLLSRQANAEIYRRGAKLLGTLFLLLIPLLGIYYLYRDGAGHTVESIKLSGASLPIAFYIFCGSQFGTVFRGLGLLPSLELNSAQAVLPLRIAAHIEAELFFSLAGATISLLLLAIYWQRPDARKSASLWLFGQSWILLSFLLPALGRWQHGLLQSLSLRYQYTALVGLAILLLPLMQMFLNAIASKERVSNFVKVGALWLFTYIALNLALAYPFDYYTTKGPQNENYIRELLALPEASDPTKVRLPESLAPGIHPLRLREIARELANDPK